MICKVSFVYAIRWHRVALDWAADKDLTTLNYGSLLSCYDRQNEPEAMEEDSTARLSLWNVLVAAFFLCLSSFLSYLLGLGVEVTTLIAGLRCWLQLTLVSHVLADLFASQNPLYVFLMTLVLVLLGAFEAVFQRSKRTFVGIYAVVLASLACAMMIGVLGVRFAVHKGTGTWWNPMQLVPILGMVIGNGVSSVAVATGYVLDQVVNHQEKIEMSLAFGATRFEAMQPILIAAVRVAVIPSINAMSVVGLISIPGMMTGSILGGAPVTEAARYQMIILFLMSGSNLMAVFSAVCMTTFLVCIDASHKLRVERISKQQGVAVRMMLQSSQWRGAAQRWWQTRRRGQYELLHAETVRSNASIPLGTV